MFLKYFIMLSHVALEASQPYTLHNLIRSSCTAAL